MSTAVSATCGVTSLWLGGYARGADYGTIWLTWWLGDVGGALVVAPALVLWATQPWPRWPRGRALEAVVLLSGVAVWGALHGVGPFIRPSPNASLLLLEAFMGVMAVTTLVVAAAVSQRRGAEAGLSRATAIVDSSDDAIVGGTAEGTILTWNGGAERLYGYRAEEVQGRPLSLLKPPTGWAGTRVSCRAPGARTARWR